MKWRCSPLKAEEIEGAPNSYPVSMPKLCPYAVWCAILDSKIPIRYLGFPQTVCSRCLFCSLYVFNCCPQKRTLTTPRTFSLCIVAKARACELQIGMQASGKCHRCCGYCAFFCLLFCSSIHIGIQCAAKLYCGPFPPITTANMNTHQIKFDIWASGKCHGQRTVCVVLISPRFTHIYLGIPHTSPPPCFCLTAWRPAGNQN